MKTEKQSTATQDKGLSPILPGERRAWQSVAFIWIGSVICIPFLMMGGILASSMTFASVFWASLIGFLVCCVLMTLGGIIGSDTGLNATMTSTHALGFTGANFSMALIAFICDVGWFAVQTATCAAAFNTLLAALNVSFPFWLSCVIWGVIMAVTAVYGVKWMSVLNYIAVPLLVILCLYGGIHTLTTSGWNNIVAAVPSNSMALTTGISITIGGFALGMTCNADYTRYCKTRGDVVKASFLGVLPAGLVMFLVGAVMTIGTGNHDITAMFANLGLPLLAMLVLILATWTTNTGNAYMAGLAACKILNIKDSKRPIVTVVSSLLGIVLAVGGLANVLSTYVGIIGALLPPTLGLIICDYFVCCKGKKENWTPVRGVNWIGIISWGVAAVFALLENLGVISVFSAAIDGIIISFVLYLILYSLFKNTKLAGNGPISLEELAKIGQ